MGRSLVIDKVCRCQGRRSPRIEAATGVAAALVALERCRGDGSGGVKIGAAAGSTGGVAVESAATHRCRAIEVGAATVDGRRVADKISAVERRDATHPGAAAQPIRR